MRRAYVAGVVGFLMVGLVSVAKVNVPAFASPVGPRTSPMTSTAYYLALGDSVPVWNGNQSYPNLILASSVTAHVPNMQLENLACSSETTDTMRYHSLCGGSQYQKALSFLDAHRGHVALVTIDIGGNDVLPCVSSSGIDYTCVSRVLAVTKKDLSAMLAGIRSAVGATTPIVGMNYFDPFLGNWLSGPAGRAATQTSVQGLVVLNAFLTNIYTTVSDPVANVQDAFHSTDLATIVASKWGNVPLAVERACTLLDITCTVGQSEGFGDDPNTAGAVVIARAFESVIGTLAPSVPQGNIFATTFKSCTTLHVGYNRFVNGTVVHWSVRSNGVGTVASGQFSAIGGGPLGSKTYHFLDIALGTTLPSEASGIQSHVLFTWANGGRFYATRDPGC
jgi:GDSL-like Lipase/Acylhydrolase family